MPFETDLLDAALARRRQDNKKQRLTTLERVSQWLETEGKCHFADRIRQQGVLWTRRI